MMVPLAVVAPRVSASHPSGNGPRPGILDVAEPVLRAWLAERGQPAMRIGQIRRQILVNRATSFDDMSDLPKPLRAELTRSFAVFSTAVERHLTASDGTQKLVLRLADGRRIECVLIVEADRATACISTQVGCGMGCVFCASGLNGVERNLTTGEIVEQLIRLRNLVAGTSKAAGHPTGPGDATGGTNNHHALTAPSAGRHAPTAPSAGRLTHVVVMGMGEPLANLENLLAALEIACDRQGLGIGQRHVTISTVGLPAKIRRLAELGKQYHLAVSLHAPNDALRTRIVPTNCKTGIAAILAAADEFYARTGRQVTYEYVVLGGLNDHPTHAKELARLLVGRKAHVNLIPWNEVDGLAYRRPADDHLRTFIDTLRRSGLSVKVRKRKGSEIDAACGQLRRRVEHEAASDGRPSDCSRATDQSTGSPDRTDRLDPCHREDVRDRPG